MDSSVVKKEQYEKVIEQLDAFYKKYHEGQFRLSRDAKMSSVVSVLKNNIPSLFFVGFYMVVDVINQDKVKTGEQYLEVGCYQSTILATPRIAKGKGQCGSAWEQSKTQVVNDVSQCTNYIACDEDTKSEIVIPIIEGGEVIGVLDIDSDQLGYFGELDIQYMERIASYITTK